MRSHPEIAMISVNNTLKPRTGGEYVYHVMKSELLRQGYIVDEASVPLLLSSLTRKEGRKTLRELYRQLLYIRCMLESLLKRLQNRCIIITSSHPGFPVFGHLVYHQPKSGTCHPPTRKHLSLYRKLGLMIIENEKLSPIWLLAKRSHILHLSNSFFTKRLVKKIYGLDSYVLYPPTLISPMLKLDLKHRRRFGAIVARPNVASGITLLPKIAENLPKRFKIVIIGSVDHVGLRVIRTLKMSGFNIDYRGYVSEECKLELFHTYSHYLHLGFNEAFGLTVVEAMASGCIPIAPYSGGIPEYLPLELLYTSPLEAAEKVIAGTGLDDFDLKIRLRSIAMDFREEKFRDKFMVYIRMLEKLIS